MGYWTYWGEGFDPGKLGLCLTKQFCCMDTVNPLN